MFSLPLHSYQQPTRAKTDLNSPRKRKRKGSRAPQNPISRDAQVTDSCAGSLGSATPSRQSTFSAVLTPDELYQCAIAGQPVEDELRSYPFPHADFTNEDGPTRYSKDLRQQLNPVHTSPSKTDGHSTTRSLHQQHMAVMTTILHRSLLEKDFVRAGRALGMILRDKAGGKQVDIRAEGRWGIGAEILIRQDAQRQRGQKESSSSNSEPNEALEKPKAWFTRKGFEDAKKYYERLVVQYPFYKQNPGAVSALDFYPAMFGLWIYVVHHEAKLKFLESDAESFEEESYGSDELRDERILPGIGRKSSHQPNLEELSQARDIADRMESVMSALPYKEDGDLIDMSRMVHTWIVDLEKALPEEKAKEDEDVTSQRVDASVEYLTSGITNVSLHKRS
jgi:RNA polymerase I specific initiation factor